jgi:mono/diheme cytochrome c family protein
MRRVLLAFVALALIGAGVFLWITRPQPLPADALAGLGGDATRGRLVFWAGGCASCHADKQAEGDARLRLGGGQKLVTRFGTFAVPNISPDPVNGIGKWTALDLANAMIRGLSPGAKHLYPAFPYASYSHASLQDVVDLKAFLDTLPAVATPSQPHDLRFPFTIRRLIGGWNWLFLRPDWVIPGPLTPEQARGRYLAEALVHCGECHTPRNALGAMDSARWLAGAPNPTGKGHIPNLTPAKLDWSADDLLTYLSTGMTPGFDSAGGDMAHVIENLNALPESDRKAIVAYLELLPPRT